MPLHASENQPRLIARVVWQLLQGERYESLADLTADVKARCANRPGGLRLRVTPDDLNAAYALIETNTALVSLTPARRDEVISPRPLVAADARAVLQRVREQLQTPLVVKPMPAVMEKPVQVLRKRTWRKDKLKSKQIIEAEILASIERCEELERALIAQPAKDSPSC
jgi:hypothetical protein